MNRKYIDFVPKKTGNVQILMPAEVDEEANFKLNAVKAKKTPRLNSADIMGRGLIDAATKKKKPETVKPVTKIEPVKAERLKIPQARFVNTEKVAKRPLSKNVYQKKVVELKEEPQGPVTIIHKPEKDSRVGLVVTIIITIILGAAAGTVAFLLLPK